MNYRVALTRLKKKCANNFFTKYGSKQCRQCKVIDDETHRIIDCPKWQGINMTNGHDKVDFSDIYSDKYETCHKVVERIVSLYSCGTWQMAKTKCGPDCKLIH